MLKKYMPKKHKTVWMLKYTAWENVVIPIIFGEGEGVTCTCEDPLVITLRVGYYHVCHILIDIRNFVNLLFLSTIQALGV